MLFESYVKDNHNEFIAGVQSLSATLGFDPNWLMSVMWLESRLNPAAVNSISDATGLIQFMPSTATYLGTSVEALKGMSAVDQLPWVYAYLKQYASKIKSFFDLYLSIFFPVAIGQPDNWIIHSSNLSAEQIARANKTFDLNGDFQITIAEFKTAVSRLLPVEALKYILQDDTFWIVATIAGLGIYYLFFN
jgi:hypothetical protein